MGGKHKQAQRTKDNAKPSSSGRSAALLTNTTTSAAHFAAVKDCGYVPIFPCLPTTTNEELDSSIDSNFQLVLKKMNKKDSTTRLKALQEFTKLVESSELDAVKAVLPFWPRLYCLLAGDIEHRVREAAQEAHRTMVVRTKRNMAPYLRQLAGPWFTAQFDTYPPVASAATRAFQDAFPANKLVEAIIFCQEDIMKYICDSLLGQPTQSTNSTKNASAEKLRARQQRIIVSCLQGFAMYLRMLPAEQLPTVAALPISQGLVSSKRFWELAGDKSPTVRSAWMSALTAVLELAPQLVVERQSQVVQAVLTRLDETEPSVLPHVWEATLHVLSSIQDWEVHSGSMDKLVLPPLWRVLSEAGHGSAATIFPNLLPVLSCLLKARCSELHGSETMCQLFFSSLREGFGKKSVVHSRAESEALAQCYVECVRYVASSGTVSPNHLVDNHLIPAIELALVNKESSLLSRALFEHVSTLAHYWSHNRSNPSCAAMLECFWAGLVDTYKKLLSAPELGTLPQQVELFLCLKTGGKRRKRVHFGGQGDNTSQQTATAPETPSEDFKQELQSFVQQVCVLYMTEVKQENQLCYIVPLSRLVAAFNSRELFEALDPNCDLSDLLDLMRRSWSSYGDEDKRASVELAFCLLRHLAPEEKAAALWAIGQECEMLLWEVRVARAHHGEPHVLQWLHSPRLRECLVRLAHQVGSGMKAEYAKTLLRDCVFTTRDGGLLISGESTAAVLSELCAAMPRGIEFAAELLSAVCSSRYCTELTESMQQLVLALFMECCRPSEEGRVVSAGVEGAWQQGLLVLAGVQDVAPTVPALVEDFAHAVKHELLTREVLATKDISHLVSLAAAAIATASNGLCPSALCATFLNGLQPEWVQWERQLMVLCLDAEQLTGAMGAHPVATSEPEANMSTDIEILRYVTLSLFTIKLISKVVFKLGEVSWGSRHPALDAAEPDMENSQSQDKVEEPGTKLNTDGMQEALSDKDTAKTPHSAESSQTTVELTRDCTQLTEEIQQPESLKLDSGSLQTTENGIQDSPQSTEETQQPEDQKLHPGSLQTTENVIQDSLQSTEETQLSEGLKLYSESLHTGEQDVEGLIPDAEDFVHLHDSFLHVVCSLAVCKVFQKHYQSTAYYNKLSPHLDLLTVHYKQVTALLRRTGLIALLEDMATEKAERSGGVWVWARFLLSSDDQRHAAYEALVAAGRAEYAAQVLVSLVKTPVPLSLLGDSPCLSTLACWLRHLDGSPAHVPAELLVGPLETWPELNNEQLLRDCNVSDKPWAEVERVSEMIRHLAACVSACPELLTELLWDFVLVSTPYYVRSLARSEQSLFPAADGVRENVLEVRSLLPVRNVAVFAVAVSELFVSFAQHVRQAVQDKNEAFLDLAEEWNSLFAGEVHQAFLNIYVKIAAYAKQVQLSLVGQRVLQSLSLALVELEAPHLVCEADLLKKPVAQESLLQACCQLVHSPVQPLQVVTYRLFAKLLPRLVYADTLLVGSLEASGAEEDAEVDASRLQVFPLLKQLQETQAVVDIMLADFRFGDSCLVQPHTDSHSYTTGYLLLWELLLDACGQAGSELRYHYANNFRSSGCLHSLLHHLFFLMPGEVLEPSCPRLMAYMFQAAPDPAPGNPSTGRQLQHWACWVYYSALRRLPALVRQWWSDTKPKVNTVVQRATYHYVTPLLVHSELQAIQSNDTRLKNMEVKVHARAREVVAVYAVDETRMELVITLPDVYPLGSVQVTSHAPLVGTNQWRNWVRHLSIFLTHQNGSVWDGLLLWKSNLDKRFEGVEECYICFSILHGSNFQIPKLCCKTCKKKFHSPCLYKWFSTSNKSTCPICRNMF